MPLRILVVEDYAPLRRLTCEALQRRTEFSVFEATDGLEALHKAEELQPDVILLDINLPELHGFEVAARLGRLAPRARLLFMSQESSPDIVQRGFDLGARGYIQKISAATDLLPAIDAVLTGQRFVSPGIALAQPLDGPAPRRHEILFCPDDGVLVRAFARHIVAALNAGDAGILLVTRSHRTEILQELRTQGVDIDGAIDRGTCVSIDADVAPGSDGVLGAIDDARAAATRAGKADPRVVLCGERAGSLWAAGRTAEAVQVEQFCRELANHVDILCAYPVPYPIDDPALMRVCAEHTVVSAS